jgi:PHD/YefM family antitoxin component YafN of YafNO toxin-antitoxin module
MGVLQKQYIKDEKGNPVGIFLSIEEYQAMVEELEDLEDTVAYLKAKAEPSDTMSLEDFLKELKHT